MRGLWWKTDRVPSEWLAKNRFDPGYLPEMEGKLFFEGERRLRSITNYIVLLTLATVIATYGVISSSTATVIGAMIIAPLMTPIMATTLAIVIGSRHRMSRSIMTVLFSVFFVIVLAIVLSIFVSPVTIDFGTNPEITTRVSPNLLALFVALASGAAGAYATSRADVSDSLPGVAIAISLVPPLSVVGISLSHAQWVDAAGALLLFLTNFLAIVLAGGAVLWFSGVSVRRVSTEGDIARKRAIKAALLGIIIVGLLLGFNGYRTLELDRDNTITWLTTESWLKGTPYTVTSVTLTYPPSDVLVTGPANVVIGIAGTGPVPDIEDLATRLERNLGYSVDVQVRVLPEQITYFPAVRPPG
jgi:uncharacterized hydrophobic protein (TIGR00271 family)